jgi:hypothetical protein
MGFIGEIIAWFQANYVNLVSLITSIIGVASIIVKLTPTLKDDDFLKKVIKFIGKYIALDKYGPKGE